MRPYNVEVFDRNFIYKDHTMIDVEALTFYVDYLDPEKNRITVDRSLVCGIDDYIRITNGAEEYFGIIREIREGNDHDKTTNEITYQDFITSYAIDVAINLDEIGTGYLEDFIAARIRENFINNPDALQNIFGLGVATASVTSDWIFDLLPDGRDGHHATVSFLDEIILKSFNKYQVLLTFSADVQHKTIRTNIRMNTAPVRVIEADLPNVTDKYIMVRKAKRAVNKVIIYNANDYAYCAIYFLHSDDSFDKANTDRITPVNLSTVTVSTDTEGESAEKIVSSLNSAKGKISSLNRKESLTDEEKEDLVAAVATIDEYLPELQITVGAGGYAYANGTKISDVTFIETAITVYEGSERNIQDGIELASELFESAAYDKAKNIFSMNTYENLIEIECLKDDTLIDPMEMGVGQVVDVISNGKSYRTLLTGKKIGDRARLIFGTLRLELTTQLKGRA